MMSSVNCESLPKTGHTSPCICTLNSLRFPSLLFISPLYNSEKGPCRCSLGFYVKSYRTDTRKCQPNPKVKKQADYSFPWKVTCDTVSRKCKIHLYNIRCTQPYSGRSHASPLSLKKETIGWRHAQLQSRTFFISFLNLRLFDRLTATHHKTYVMPSQWVYMLTLVCVHTMKSDVSIWLIVHMQSFSFLP